MKSFINNHNTKLLIVFTLLLAALPESAHAQALFDSGTNFLTALMDLLTNTWARLIGIIAVTVLGILFLRGRIEWQPAVAIVIGLIIIFGAPALVDSVQGSL